MKHKCKGSGEHPVKLKSNGTGYCRHCNTRFTKDKLIVPHPFAKVRLPDHRSAITNLSP